MTFDAAAEQDYSDVDCLAVAILTHGGDDGTLCGTDAVYDPSTKTYIAGTISIDNLLKPLKKRKSLFGKPKLVFIQVRFVNVSANKRLVQLF